MTPLPHDTAALLLLVFSLGARHGFDADHLATIDGLTRHHAARRPRLARLCGTLFSLGHGSVVIAIAIAVGGLADTWQAPFWLEHLGAWLSIVVLCALAVLNLAAARRTAPGAMVAPVGLRSALLGPPGRHRGPLGVALIGALFALSIDTVSQAALFALAARQLGGWQAAAGLGVLFTAGMLLTDGLNGVWIARLMRRADALAARTSRLMSLGIAAISLLVAGLGLARLGLPAVAAWSDEWSSLLGAVVMLLVLASFFIAWRGARHDPAILGG